METGGGDHQENQKPEDGTNDSGDVLWQTHASSRKPTTGKKSVSFLLPPFVLRDGEIPPWAAGNVFAGRYVTCVSTTMPFRVSRHYVQPKLNQELSLRSLTEDIVRTICGFQDLTNVLLAITPTSLPNTEEDPYRHKVHIYRLDNQRHLCATALTLQERELIEQYHDDDNYSILHCSRPIELEDAARNSPIRTQIFETVRDGSLAVRSTWYKGHPMSLSLKLRNRLRIGLHATQNRFGIRSLREPKIPIRMTRFTCLEAKEEATIDELTLAKDSNRTAKVLNRRQSVIQDMRQRKFRKPSMLGDNQENHDGTSRDFSQFCSQDSPKIKSILKNSLPTEPPRKDSNSKKKLAGEGNTEAISSDVELDISIDIPTVSDYNSSESELNIRKSVRLTDLQEGYAEQPNALETRLKLRGRKPLEPMEGELTEEAELDSESEGLIQVPSVIPSISSYESMIEKSSSFFNQHVNPVASPTSFSPESGAKIENMLKNPNVRKALRKFGMLVDRINRDIQPQSELLLTFFQLVEMLDLKMLVRLELSYLGWGKEPRYVVECYLFENRQDFVASIGLLCQQLHHFTDVCPGAAKNLRFVDNAFELTNLPRKVTGCLKTMLSAIHARGLYDLLGELTLLLVHPPATTLSCEDRDNK